MPKKGYLLVMMEAPPALEEEFHAWYDTEHIPERLAVPGFETGLRYVCIDGAPRYLAMYDLADPAVIESPAYLKVSFDQASPWTKRVTSRVKVYRYAGEQVHPGNALTGRAARIVLLRFRDLGPDDGKTVLTGMLSNFGNQPETRQIRVFSHTCASGVDYFGMVEAGAPLNMKLDLEPFGACAAGLDLVNTYVPY